MSSAAHSRQHRQRRARGDRSWRVWVNGRTIEKMIDAGLLTDGEAEDGARVQVELASLLEWAADFREKNRHQ